MLCAIGNLVHFVQCVIKSRLHPVFPGLNYSAKLFFLPEVHRRLFVRDDLLQVDDVLVSQLAEDLDLADCSDGETFLLVLQADLKIEMLNICWIMFSAQFSKKNL